MGERAAWWKDGLDHRDWLYDGHKILGKETIARFKALDWSKAYMDMGPSVAGNLGPYWHVPLGGKYADEETVHRLYPKVLLSKWLRVIRRACEEAAERERRLRRLPRSSVSTTPDPPA